MKFQKKPVVIDAWPIDDLCHADQSDHGVLPQDVAEAANHGDLVIDHWGVTIRTLEGTMRGERTDYLIRGIKGEFYPCKPDIFAATYEEVPS